MIIILIILCVFFSQTENFAGSTEAIQNLSSMYNKDTITAKDINATGTITATGHVKITGAGKSSAGDGFTHFNHPDGNNYIRGHLHVNGNTNFGGPTKFENMADHVNAAHFGGFGTDTWFPFTDGRNYIRGPLNIDGPTNVTSSLTTHHANGITLLTQSGRPLNLRAHDHGNGKDMILQFQNTTNGKWTNLNVWN